MADRYAVATGNWGSTSTWSATSGGAPGATVPSSAQDVEIPAGITVTVASGHAFAKALTCIGNCGLAITGGDLTTFGNVTLSSTMTFTNTVGLFLGGTCALTTAGKNLGDIVGIVGAVTLQDACTLSGTMLNGSVGGTPSLNTNNQNLTASVCDWTTTSGITLSLTLGSSLITLTGTGTVWNVAGAGTVNVTANTSTIKLTNSSASGKTFASGGKTYATVWFAPGSGTGTFTVTGAATFGELKDDGTAAHTVVLPASATTTVTTFNINGTSGQRISLRSSSAGTQATLSKASSTVNATFLDIKDIAATGGATFNATFSINSGNNSGWNITQPATMTQAIIIA